MKAKIVVLLLGVALAGWAFTSPDADPRAQRLEASIAPPLAGIDARTGRRIPHAPPLPGELRTMSIKSLGNFSYDPAHGNAIPADVQRLSGMTIRLQGYMLATQQASDQLTHFALVPSRFACCYGQPPGVQHTVIVTCPTGAPASYNAGLVWVEGKLTVHPARDDGYVVSLFELAATRVAPANSAN
jgi:hypothetical protein